MAELFYLQDKRSYVGNDMVFWAKDGKGYTTDLSKAHVFTRDDAFAQNKCRHTDIPWPKEYIDAKVRPAVDMQYVDISEAMPKVSLAKPPKETGPPPFNCAHCGRFVSEGRRYESCPNCGEYNMP